MLYQFLLMRRPEIRPVCGDKMKIKSEYSILSECITRGIDYGYSRAYKHTDKPSEETIKNEIYNAVTNEVCEYFSFEENYE